MMRDGGQAFPNEGFNGWGMPQEGMTLRDYFAAKALQGLITTGNPKDEWDEPEMAKWSYKMAAAMLKARGE
jgi:hypothetical protein